MKKYSLFIRFEDGEIMHICGGLSQFDACRAVEAIGREFDKLGTNSVVFFDEEK